MIFVTVGTWRSGFNRLLQAVDNLKKQNVIKAEVLAQTGYSSYQPHNLRTIKFCSPDEFTDYITRADLVIAHAGVGTILSAIRSNKPIIVLPRKASLGEVDNNHQFVTARQLESERKILVAYTVNDLPRKLDEARNFVPAAGCGAQQIIDEVQRFIEDVAAQKQRPKRHSVASRKIWPFEVLHRTDEQIKNDLKTIMLRLEHKQLGFDMVVFIPKAGLYLSRLFRQCYPNTYEIGFVTTRRASTVAKTHCLKAFIFKRKWASNLFRHIEVLARLIKLKMGIEQRMVTQTSIDFDVRGKRILVIDDSCETGTTINTVKSLLLSRGAQSVTAACITRDLVPEQAPVDCYLYDYKLLRTRNSRDYYAR